VTKEQEIGVNEWPNGDDNSKMDMRREWSITDKLNTALDEPADKNLRTILNKNKTMIYGLYKE